MFQPRITVTARKSSDALKTLTHALNTLYAPWKVEAISPSSDLGSYFKVVISVSIDLNKEHGKQKYIKDYLTQEHYIEDVVLSAEFADDPKYDRQVLIRALDMAFSDTTKNDASTIYMLYAWASNHGLK